jgi:DNA replication protein DnaC
MNQSPVRQPAQPGTAVLETQLTYLKLPAIQQHYQTVAQQASREQWPPVQYLETLVAEEAEQRQLRATERRLRQARFPVTKTLEQYQWQWPTAINEMQVKQLFRLAFIPGKANAIFLGGVGLGKTHLAIALGYQACLKGYSVCFTTAVAAINNLCAAQAAGRLKQELARYGKPDLLVLDELGYLPIDKTGADLLFQIISQRYESGAMVITSNRVYKNWVEIFNNDATLTSAILDRLLHHAETIVIEGKSYRMKDRIDK